MIFDEGLLNHRHRKESDFGNETTEGKFYIVLMSVFRETTINVAKGLAMENTRSMAQVIAWIIGGIISEGAVSSYLFLYV